MKAILVAAGFGTRLRPITDTIPKCLVPIHNRPLLQIWLDRLSKSGAGPFLINTHYLSDQVTQFVESSIFNNQVTLVEEQELLGTAGTLIANLDFFQDEDGLFIHADNYCLADFKAFKREHLNRPQECMMTMMTFRTDDPSSCGIVEIDNRGVVMSFHEKVKSPAGNLANGAVYILSPQMLNKLSNEFKSATDFSTQVLPHFVGQIYNYTTSEMFLDIGTPENYAKANK